MSKEIHIVHIADLHAGKVNQRILNRNEDLLYAFHQLEDFCKSYPVDYLIVAGDIFDKTTPDNESIELISEFFIKIAEKGIKVLAITGNHDSNSFFKAWKPWSRKLGIKIATTYDLITALKEKNFEGIIEEDDEIAFLLLPFLSERAITELKRDESSFAEYSEKFFRILNYLTTNIQEKPIKIWVAHSYFAECKLGYSERESELGKNYALPQNRIPPDFSYVALGHIHKYQKLDYAPTVAYYSGSLYQLDFGEREERKFFNYITIKPNEANNPHVEKIELKLLRRLKKITLYPSDDFEKVLLSFPKEYYFWIQLIIEEGKHSLGMLKNRIEKILSHRLVKITHISSKQVVQKKNTKELDINLFNPLEIYRKYRLSVGKKLSPALENKLKEILEKTLQEN
jgi:exonuclease SbcD